MVWVLWDFFIPFLASFALGTLFTWLILRWSQRDREGLVVESGATKTDAKVVDAVPVSGAVEKSVDAAELRAVSAELKAVDAANIILIGERDEASLALEGMQEETTVMKQRIAELEAENAEKSNQMTATAPADLTAPLVVDKQASAELQRVQADLDSLNDTLNNERKARRATELELLNTKNRHEKFVADLPVQISEEEHQREITDREKQIDALKLQLAKREVIEPKEQIPDADLVEKMPEKSSKTESPDDTSTTSPVKNRVAAQNGHTPKGWSVPGVVPAGEERDKLTAIKGVGKVLEKILHDCGIYYYHQVASLDKSGIEELQAQIPQFPGRIQRDRWVEQAKELQQNKELVAG